MRGYRAERTETPFPDQKLWPINLVWSLGFEAVDHLEDVEGLVPGKVKLDDISSPLLLEDGSYPECPICFDPIHSGGVETECTHMFHGKKCLLEWANADDKISTVTCPCDRKILAQKPREPVFKAGKITEVEPIHFWLRDELEFWIRYHREDGELDIRRVKWRKLSNGWNLMTCRVRHSYLTYGVSDYWY